MNTNWTPFSMWYFIIDLEAFVNFLFKFLSLAINRPSVSLFFLPLSPPYLAFCEALLVCVVNSWRPLVKLLSRVLHSYLSTPFLRTSPVVQWLRLQASTTRGMGLIPHAEWQKKRKRKKISLFFVLQVHFLKWEHFPICLSMSQTWWRHHHVNGPWLNRKTATRELLFPAQSLSPPVSITQWISALVAWSYFFTPLLIALATLHQINQQVLLIKCLSTQSFPSPLPPVATIPV